jgi:hypothetical protein
MNTTVVTAADRLRAALKQAGFTARQATVRQRHSTLHVTIRDAAVSLTRVTAIAAPFEVVRRDQASGEILCGGNTYVDIEYAPAVVAPVKASLLAILESAPNDEAVTLPGGYRAMKVTRERGATYYGEVRIWGRGFEDRNHIAVGISHAAERIAVACLDASASGEGSAT